MNLFRLSATIQSQGFTPPTLLSSNSLDRLHSQGSTSSLHNAPVQLGTTDGTASHNSSASSIEQPSPHPTTRQSSRHALLTAHDRHSSSVTSISSEVSQASGHSNNESHSNLSLHSIMDRETLAQQQNQLYMSSFKRTRQIMRFFAVLHLVPQLIIVALIIFGLACAIYFAVNRIYKEFLVQYLICSLIGVYFIITETIFAVLYFKASRRCSDTLSTSIIVFLSIHLSLLLCANLLSVGFVMYSPLSALPMAYSVVKFCYSWIPAYMYAKAVYSTRNHIIKRRFRSNLRSLAQHHGLDERSARLVMTATGQYVLLVRPREGAAQGGAGDGENLPPVNVDKFPTIIFSKTSLEDAEVDVKNPRNATRVEVRYDTCSICLEEFQDKCKVTELTCSHWFHQKCISQWLKSGKYASCPVCRLDLRAATKEADSAKPPRIDSIPSVSVSVEDSEYPMPPVGWDDEPTLHIGISPYALSVPNLTISPSTPTASEASPISQMHSEPELVNTPVEPYRPVPRNATDALDEDLDLDDDSSAQEATLSNMFGYRPPRLTDPHEDSPIARGTTHQFVYKDTPV